MKKILISEDQWYNAQNELIDEQIKLGANSKIVMLLTFILIKMYQKLKKINEKENQNGIN